LLAQGEYPELDFLDPKYVGPPMSAGRLQTFAVSPYAYFVKYILGVRPLDEPALNDDPWLTPLRKGDILHRTFDAFMRAGNRDANHLEGRLYAMLDREISRIAKRVYPGNQAKRGQIQKQLRRAVDLFTSSVESQDALTETVLSEWGFGYRPRYQRDGDIGDFKLHLDSGDELPLRGRIDRVDWHTDDEEYLIWDYKTGSQSSFSRTDPLKGGAKLQWALYARIIEQHKGKPVRTSGYHFLSAKENGTKLVYEMNGDTRAELEDIVLNLAELARTGTFPLHEKAKDNSPWKWGDYDPLFWDLDARCEQLRAKEYPKARSKPRSWGG
jgi:ATP-dependent helicase/DNAse subunit B